MTVQKITGKIIRTAVIDTSLPYLRGGQVMHQSSAEAVTARPNVQHYRYILHNYNQQFLQFRFKSFLCFVFHKGWTFCKG